MGLRTIDAPGVEIKEIDKSGYAPAMTGTKCFVMGYANKGEPYFPMEFTSKAAWQIYYGEPETEAERYFYNACTEVINQNGVLYCARIPYDNDSLNKMVGFKYSVDGNTTDLSTLSGFTAITESDPNIKKCIKISPTNEPISVDLSAVDEYRTGESKVESNNFLIVDKTCAKYQKIMEDERKGVKRELLGIFPVITTAANALYTQKLIDVENQNVHFYESVSSVITKYEPSLSTGFSLLSTDIVKQFDNSGTNFDEGGVKETVSLEANSFFSTINMNAEGTGFDSENLKKIGVVVFKAYLDASEGNKVNFTPVEAFCGSLDKDATNPNTKKTIFIDTLVNTQSEYIYFFSNCFNNATKKKTLDDAGIFIIEPGKTGMLGFYESETVKEISVSSLLQGIDKCFVNVEDINERDIDIIPDAGLANIAQFISSV